MTFLERIAECNRHDLSRFAKLYVQGIRAGWVRRDRLPVLEAWPDLVTTRDGAVHVAGDDEPAASRAFSDLADRLVDVGEIPNRHGELYAVATLFEAPTLAVVDRQAVSWFGVLAHGVHINGFVRGDDGISMWVAVRSPSKATFPGMLDNMVAGGQPFGITPDDNVRKECAEEAGVPDELSRRATSVSAVSYCAEHDRGLKPDTMFCYDLELPADFEPRVVDGEVERFELWPIERVAETVATTQRFKFNCNLVVIDFLVRHGLLGPDDPDYAAIVDGLNQPLGLHP